MYRVANPILLSYHYGTNESPPKSLGPKQCRSWNAVGSLLCTRFLCFFFVFHVGEFTVNSTFDPEIHLSINDLQVDCLLNPSCVTIHIKCSKTDPFHSGCDIYLGKVNSDICPLAAIGSYLHVRGDAPGPLFLFRDGRPLRQILASKIQHILHLDSYSGAYSVHSFRIDPATTAASCGIPDHLIKTLGRSSSDPYQVYIRTPIIAIVKVMSQ